MVSIDMRKAPIILALVALLGAIAPIARADTPSFDRYQVILTRKPFGAPPPPPEPPRAPVVEERKFTEGFRLTMIVESEDGEVSAGFVDNQNKSYMMFVGDIKNEIELVSADYDAGEVVLKKGERLESLKFASAGGSSAPASAPALTNQKEAEANRASYAERRRARAEQLQREQEAAQKVPEPQFTGEALEKHLHEYQMEIIRQGLPPLPIPLTPEQDDQLVAEGYLPPVQ